MKMPLRVEDRPSGGRVYAAMLGAVQDMGEESGQGPRRFSRWSHVASEAVVRKSLDGDMRRA